MFERAYIEFYSNKGMIYGREVDMMYNRHDMSVCDRKNNTDSIYLSFVDKITFETTAELQEDIFIRIRAKEKVIETNNKCDFRLNKLKMLRKQKNDIHYKYTDSRKIKYTIRHIAIPKNSEYTAELYISLKDLFE